MNSSMQGIMPADYQMMRLQQANGMQMNGDLRAKAMQNRGNAAFQPYVASRTCVSFVAHLST